jgi:hypothetical protein
VNARQNASSAPPRWNGATGVGTKNRISPQFGMLHDTSVISSTTASSRLVSALPGAQRCSGALMPTTSRKRISTALSGKKPAVRLASA